MIIEVPEKLTCYKIVAAYPESKYGDNGSIIEGKSYRTPFCNVNIPDEAIAGKTAFVAEGDPEVCGSAGNLRVAGGFIHSYADAEDALRDIIHHFYRLPEIYGRKYELWECEIAPDTLCFRGQFECESTQVYASGSVRFVKCLTDSEADARKLEKELMEKKFRKMEKELTEKKLAFPADGETP